MAKAGVVNSSVEGIKLLLAHKSRLNQHLRRMVLKKKNILHTVLVSRVVPRAHWTTELKARSVCTLKSSFIYGHWTVAVLAEL